MNDIKTLLVEKAGGIKNLENGWRWRSHSPEKRAAQAICDAAQQHVIANTKLITHGASPDQIKEWTDKFLTKWIAYIHVGSRTANPMITGPANFPADRNRKRMDTEMKRWNEFSEFADGAQEWMRRRNNSAARAILSKEAKAVDHKEQVFGSVRVVYNKTIDRIQLIFPGKPSDEDRAILKKRAFRWSPREGAWQRKLTNNGVWAAQFALKDMGHIKTLAATDNPSEI